MLYDHGFMLANRLIEAMGWSEARGSIANPYQPWSDDTIRQSQQRGTIGSLRSPVRVFPRPSALWDRAILPYVVVLLMCLWGMWALTPTVSRTLSAAMKWLDEQQFERYPSDDLKFNP
jgi:hypothetical protein